jgi:hypothetical protein
MSGLASAFAVGERVRIRVGKYAGLRGFVIDSSADSEILPAPALGFFWVRIVLHTFLVPVHVHADDIEAELETISE